VAQYSAAAALTREDRLPTRGVKRADGPWRPAAGCDTLKEQMAGSRTRYGFAGDDDHGNDRPRTAPTLLGHDTHAIPLPGVPAAAADPVPAAADPVPAAAAVPLPVPAEPAPEAEVRPPPHTGKSNYPTVARLFGRWDQEGKLLPDGPPVPAPDPAPAPDSLLDGDSLHIPRERIPRWVLLAIAAGVVLAVVGFLMTGRNAPRPAPPPATTLALPPPPAPAPVVSPPSAPAAASPGVLASTRRAPRSDAPRRRHRAPRVNALSDDALPPSF
jgi:hypothetical protein